MGNKYTKEPTGDSVFFFLGVVIALVTVFHFTLGGVIAITGGQTGINTEVLYDNVSGSVNIPGSPVPGITVVIIFISILIASSLTKGWNASKEKDEAKFYIEKATENNAKPYVSDLEDFYRNQYKGKKYSSMGGWMWLLFIFILIALIIKAGGVM